ncbi:MAG: hypothetical protein LUG18_13335 [Candidatus Azobacteroides sp.]|nr:hypothetical protein [Candidatus Azobacteroides sp.]
MKNIYLISFLGVFFSMGLYPQMPSDPFMRKQHEKCLAIVREIEAMPLICDTISIWSLNEGNIINSFKGIYFDDQNRLRKYYRQERMNDGAHEWADVFAYYDEGGNVCYIIYQISNNCEGGELRFGVHQERIISYDYSWDCGCCEEDEETEMYNEQRRKCFHVGGPLVSSCDDKMSFRNFLYAERLIKVLKDKEYDGYEEYNEPEESGK